MPEAPSWISVSGAAAAQLSSYVAAVWNHITPQLPVSDLEASLAWYREVLGFEQVWSNAGFGGASGQTVELFFQRADGPIQPLTCCVRVDDADALCAKYKERGVEIIAGPEDQPWGMREFSFIDPDGHRFRVGHMIEQASRWVPRPSR